MTQEQLNELLHSQQGELNAVLMYQHLAKVVKTDKEREAFDTIIHRTSDWKRSN